MPFAAVLVLLLSLFCSDFPPVFAQVKRAPLPGHSWSPPLQIQGAPAVRGGSGNVLAATSSSGVTRLVVSLGVGTGLNFRREPGSTLAVDVSALGGAARSVISARLNSSLPLDQPAAVPTNVATYRQFVPPGKPASEYPPQRRDGTLVPALGAGFDPALLGILFGGIDTEPATNIEHNDVWKLVETDDGSTGSNGGLGSAEWIKTNSSNNSSQTGVAGIDFPGGRCCHAAAAVKSRGSMLIHGGFRSAPAPIYLKDLWEYSISHDNWTRLSTTGDVPSGRYFHAGVYSQSRETFVVFGGWENELGNGPVSDLFRLDLLTGVWAKLSPVGSVPTPVYWMSISWRDAVLPGDQDTMYLVGGFDVGGSALNATWEYTEYNGRFLELTDAPSARGQAVVGLHDGDMWLHGGRPATSGDPLDTTVVYAGLFTPSSTTAAPVTTASVSVSTGQAVAASTASASAEDLLFLWIIVGVVGAVVVCIVAVCVAAFLFLKTRQRTPQSGEPTELQSVDTDRGYASLHTPGSYSAGYESNDSLKSAVSEITSPGEALKLPPELAGSCLEYSELDLAESQVLGNGAFGVVYLGKLAGRPVAVKEILADRVEESELAEFVREATVMQQVPHHPNVLPFVGITPAPFCILVQYCELGDLWHYLEEHNSDMTLTLKMSIMTQIALGCRHLIAHGVIHRYLISRRAHPPSPEC
jgi:Protein tyrosine and serine/threonine kinase/Galactose oxidase, central domain